VADLPTPATSGYSRSMHQHGDTLLRPLALALALGLLLLRLAR
jgi:hypothetical protein